MNTREFKVGDKVRLVDSDGSNVQERNLGNVGIVLSIGCGNGVEVKFCGEEFIPAVLNNRLELVQDEPQDQVFTREEALKMAIDGHKVRPTDSAWDGTYVTYENGGFVYVCSSGKEQATLVLTRKQWKRYSPPQTPKFTVGSFVMNHANDIGKITGVIIINGEIPSNIRLAEGKIDSVSDVRINRKPYVLYRVTFNGLTSKVMPEDELKEAM